MRQHFKYFIEFFRLSTGNSIILIFASLLSALVQMLTAITIIPVIRQLDGNIESEASIAEFAISAHDLFAQIIFIEKGLISAISFMLIALLTFSIISFIIEAYSAKVSALIVRKLRVEVLDTLVNASWSYFGKRGSSDAVNHIITESAKIAHGYRKVISTKSYLIQAAALLVFSFYISSDVTAVVLVSSLLVVLVFLPVLRASKKLGENNRKLIKDVTSSTLMSFDNIKSVKAMSINHLSSDLKKATIELEKNTYLLSLVSAITNNFRLPLTVVIIVVILSMQVVYDESSIALALPLLFLFERISKAVGYTQNSYQSFLKLLPFYVSFNDSMRLANEYKEGDFPVRIDAINDIVLDNASFSYSGSIVFRDADVRFESSTLNLIIGDSGSGKTSLVDLIIGISSPSSGHVLVNGENLDLINIKSYRSKIGYVPQEVFLLNTSLRDNVLIGRRGFLDQDVMNALDLAGLSDLCSALPHGLDSGLGENGRLISGGQRQRVLIARALLAKPYLLILDEPTSGLDSDSAQRFIDSIKCIKSTGVIVIIVSHDMSLLKHADNVLRLQDNCVVEILNEN